MSRKLNAKQIQTLKVVLKFRYVTTDNLATYKNITHNSAYSSLEILYKSGYLGKIHDKSYRLLNKSARYYATKQTLEYFRQTQGIELDKPPWKSRLSDDKKTSGFIDEQIAIHAARNQLVKTFGDTVRIMTAIETHAIEGIIKPLPGLYVYPPSGRHFFVDVTDGQHLFIAKKRIRKYIENYESTDWEWNDYPNVYLIRSSANDRTRLREYIQDQMDDNYLDESDFSFYVVGNAGQIKLG